MQTESMRTSDFLTRLPSLIRISFKALLSPEALACLQSQMYNLLFFSTQVCLGGGRKGKSPFIFSSHIVFQALNAFDALQYDHQVSAIKAVQWQRNNSFSLHYDLSTKMMKPLNVTTSAVHNVMEDRMLFLSQAGQAFM